jgi:hypothetical protein
MEGDRGSGKGFFFVDVSLRLFWFLLLVRFFNWRIYVFDTGKNLSKSTLLRRMHDRKWIVRITEQHYAFCNSHSVAIELADRIVNQISGSAVIQLASELYKSKETDLVFKKTIAKHLSLLTSINQYIINNQKIIDPTLFISERYRKILQGNPKVLDASITVKYGLYWVGVKLKVTWLAVVLGYFLHLLVQPFCKKSTNEKTFKYAISVSASWATKFKGAREFTFLVDDNIIKKKETVFLVEYPEGKEFYQYYSDDGYNLIEALGVQKISNLFRKSTLRVRDDFFKVVSLLIARKQDFFVYEALISLLFHRMGWSIIVAQTSFQNYIYFNKEGRSQNVTNIFLKQKKIITHAYSQFIGGPYQVCGNDSILDERHVHYSFLNPDYYYLNNQAMLDSMLLHYQDVVQYKVIGNIFSEKIIEIRNNNHYIEQLRGQYNIENSKKVVSIFDTTYVEIDKLYSTYDEAQYFLKAVIKLAKSMPECMFLFKPSKKDMFFLKGYWSDKKGSKIVQLRHEFGQLENATMLQDTDDVMDIIGVSNVVFTNSFSSPTADALLADVPAFWYQAKTDVSFSIYNKIPNLVIDSYKDLTTQIKKLLQDGGSVDFKDNSDFTYLVGDTDEKALTSLRLNFSNA